MNHQKIILLLSLILPSVLVVAQDDCFLVKENNIIITENGNCKLRYSPASTFKIAIALMGYDSGILKDEEYPLLMPPSQQQEMTLNVWKDPHTPKTWMKNSCVWYSQVLTKQLGIEKFKNYVMQFNYGNQDVTGDKGENNGLSNCWLSSSLMISAEEQIEFLQKLLNNQLPVSKKSCDKVKNIMFIKELAADWKLYGKTGSGTQLDINKSKTNLQHGWFVGWIEKNDRKVIFASHVSDDQPQSIFASLRARDRTFNELLSLIDLLENQKTST